MNEEDRLMPEETVLCKQDKLASSLILALTLDFPPPKVELIFILSSSLTVSSLFIFISVLLPTSRPISVSFSPFNLFPPFNQPPWFLRYVLAQQPLDSGRGYRCRDVNDEGRGVHVYNDIPLFLLRSFLFLNIKNQVLTCVCCAA